jgi:hypothetical protein
MLTKFDLYIVFLYVAAKTWMRYYNYFPDETGDEDLLDTFPDDPSKNETLTYLDLSPFFVFL